MFWSGCYWQNDGELSDCQISSLFDQDLLMSFHAKNDSYMKNPISVSYIAISKFK